MRDSAPSSAVVGAIVVIACGGVARAGGDAGVAIDADGALPFTAEELRLAVEARLPTIEPPPDDEVRVLVRAVSDGVVVVIVGERAREVPVGDRRGEAAARLVAVHVTDLFAAEAVIDALPAEPPIAEAAAAPAGLALLVVPATPAPRRAATWELAAAVGVTQGMASTDLLAGVIGVDAIARVGRWRVGAGAAYTRAPTVDDGLPSEAGSSQWSARLRAGRALGPLAIFAGVFAASYHFHSAVPRDGTAVGVTASVRGAWPVRAGVLATAEIGIDAYRNNVVLSVPGVGDARSTPRAAATVTVGVLWAVGP